MPNVAIPGPPEGLWGLLKFHQVAIYHAWPEKAVEDWTGMGYSKWIHDSATLTGTEWFEQSSKIGYMWFNYDILPMELEYVRYDSPTRHSGDERTGDTPFISHMSTYVDDVDATVHRINQEHDWLPYHQFLTGEHRNPAVIERGLRFKEAIYDTRGLLGFDIKLIQRIER